MKFVLAQESRIGKRRMNQDRMESAQSSAAILLVVADGMGGHRHGEVAAQIAVDQLVVAFRRAAVPRLDDPRRFLFEAIVAGHCEINNYAAQRAMPLAQAPRTTVVACVIQDGRAVWAHVGDSRLYYLRKAALLMRTRDHSRVQMLVDSGLISEEEAQRHPQRNLVHNCLGGDILPHVDLAPPLRLEKNDIIALCSDGAWGPLADRFPAGFVLPLDRAVPRLLNDAEAAGGQHCDNLTLLALQWQEDAVSEEEEVSGHTTRPLWEQSTVTQPFSHLASGEPAFLSDADIDRAIDEIRNRIKAKKLNGAP